jgi:hypothetical protein
LLEIDGMVEWVQMCTKYAWLGQNAVVVEMHEYRKQELGISSDSGLIVTYGPKDGDRHSGGVGAVAHRP